MGFDIVSRREFFGMLLEKSSADETACDHASLPSDEPLDEEFDPVVYKAYRLGIADAADLRDPEGAVVRSDAARILHAYMKKIIRIPDIPDISEAEAMKDLYDCSACTNHIAQVFMRGIMAPRDMPSAGGRYFFVFDLGAKLERADAVKAVDAAANLKNEDAVKAVENNAR